MSQGQLWISQMELILWRSYLVLLTGLASWVSAESSALRKLRLGQTAVTFDTQPQTSSSLAEPVRIRVANASAC